MEKPRYGESDYSGRGLTDAQLQKLIDGGELGVRFTSLNLSGNKLTGAGVKALGTHLAMVEELDLSGNPVGDAGAAQLAGNPVFASLRVLKLARVGLTAKGVDALVGPVSRLEVWGLTLDSNPLGDAGAAAVVRGARARYLTTLSLEDVGLSDAGARALGDAGAGLPELTHLYLGRNGLTQATADSLEQALRDCDVSTQP